MDALTALHTRTSSNLLCEPGPSAVQLENIVKAGLRACDHRNLQPWEFIFIEGDARQAFGDLMVVAKEASDGQALDSIIAEKIRKKPMRAPTIVAVVAKIQKNPKVPDVEQVLSAGAAAQMMMTAAYAQGIGAIWRSGSMMFREEMKSGLGLRPIDQIVGFLYLGTPKVMKPSPQINPNDFVRRWEGS
jgi:nitroreductase